MSPVPDRILALDTVRGFAVCGILVMNIVSMGMPSAAYIDPTAYGGAGGADLAVWATAYVLADGKMRALFTMLFGASLLLITDAAEEHTPGPARTHYGRMAWLFVFGMLHAWFVWYGDILVEYSIVGAIAFVGHRWPPGALLYAAVLLIAADLAQNLIGWRDMTVLRRVATAPNAPADAVTAWENVRAMVAPSRAAIVEELRLYRGGFAEVFAARAEMTRLFQLTFLPAWLPGTTGFAFLGMWLYRRGFWTGAWRGRSYRLLLLAGAATLPLYLPLVHAILARGFDPVFQPLADALTLLLRPWLALAYASALILLVRSGRARPLVERVAAAGRMAFSNYLGTSLVLTTIFYGYGLGLFGRLGRAELYLLVFGQWLLILAWSGPWLARFRYGPFEWLWRSLARGERQPLTKAVAT